MHVCENRGVFVCRCVREKEKEFVCVCVLARLKDTRFFPVFSLRRLSTKYKVSHCNYSAEEHKETIAETLAF